MEDDSTFEAQLPVTECTEGTEEENEDKGDTEGSVSTKEDIGGRGGASSLSEIKSEIARANDPANTARENVDFADDADDSVMIGVEIFEESDLEVEAEESKLQLYSVGGEVEPTEEDVASTLTSSTKKKHKEPTRLSLEDRIKCIRLCSRYGTYVDAQKAWRQKYGTEPPCKKTFSTLDKKFRKTGSVADLVRTGRPKTTRTEAIIAKVEDAVRKDPTKSIRTLAKELGINQASVHRIKKAFEDKKNTLKLENRKLKERLNDALKRIILLEKRLAHLNSSGEASVDNNQPEVETLVITSQNDDHETTAFTTHIDPNHVGSNLPTIILNSSSANGQITVPSVLRVQHPGQDVVHIITLPQTSSSSQHQLLTLDDSSTIQLTLPNDGVSQSHDSNNFQSHGHVYTLSQDSNTMLSHNQR